MKGLRFYVPGSERKKYKCKERSVKKMRKSQWNSWNDSNFCRV